MQTDAETSAYDALAQHAHIADLAAVAHAVMARAVEKRDAERQAEWVTGLAGQRHLTREDSAT
ncbi:MAG: hypothetical protein ACREJ3_07200, partial [Polyangiaceae bacterium]